MAGSEGTKMVEGQAAGHCEVRELGIGCAGMEDRGGRDGLGVSVCVLVYNDR